MCVPHVSVSSYSVGITLKEDGNKDLSDDWFICVLFVGLSLSAVANCCRREVRYNSEVLDSPIQEGASLSSKYKALRFSILGSTWRTKY